MIRQSLRTLSKRVTTRVELTFLVSWIAVAAAILSFLMLAGEVSEGESTAFDSWFMEGLRLAGQPHVAIGPPWLVEIMRDVTALGSVTVLLIVTAIFSVGLLLHGRKAQGGILVAAVILAFLSSNLFKLLYARVRPDFAVLGVLPVSHSFPSGHSTTATATYFVFATIVASLEVGREAKVFAFAVAAFLSVAVGFSRVYLGVHWPSDVIAGWLLGAGWAVLTSVALTALNARMRTRLNPEQ